MTYRGSLLLLVVVCTVGCADSARIAPPVEAGAEDQRRFSLASGAATQVSVLVEERPWGSRTRRLLIQHTPLFVEIRNEGPRTVRYRAEDIALRVGDARYEAVDVTRLVADADPGLEEARIAKTEGIRGATLAPGDTERGFVFFRKKIPEDEPSDEALEVTLQLYDATHAQLLEVIRIPLVVVLPDD